MPVGNNASATANVVASPPIPRFYWHPPSDTKSCNDRYRDCRQHSFRYRLRLFNNRERSVCQHHSSSDSVSVDSVSVDSVSSDYVRSSGSESIKGGML